MEKLNMSTEMIFMHIEKAYLKNKEFDRKIRKEQSTIRRRETEVPQGSSTRPPPVQHLYGGYTTIGIYQNRLIFGRYACRVGT